MIDALVERIGSRDGVLATVFFGPVAQSARVAAADGAVHATDGVRQLRVVLASYPAGAKAMVPPVTPTAPNSRSSRRNTDRAKAKGSPVAPTEATTSVTVATDCTRYHFSYLAPRKVAPEAFLDLDIDELAAEVALVGSVWSSVFPSHRSILTRTVAMSVPREERGILFDQRKGRLRGLWTALRPGLCPEARREIRALDRLRSVFGRGDGLQLLSIEDLRQRLALGGGSDTKLSERQTGDLVVRTYQPPYSKVVQFHPAAPLQGASRGDYVLSYQPRGSQTEFYREFVVSIDDWKPEEIELYRAAMDILHVLAIRRSGLFRLGFAERVYTVLMPPALLTDGSRNHGIFFAPCVILYQVPQNSTFRRTFTISYIAIPVELDADNSGEKPVSPLSRIRGPRAATIDELRALRRDLRAHVVPDHRSGESPLRVLGPLAELLGTDGRRLTLPQMLQEVGEFIARRIIANGDSSDASTAAAMMLTATVESTLSAMLLQVEWSPPTGAAQPWEDWLITGKDRAFADNVYKLMFYEDFMSPRSGYTSRRGIDLARMLVGNTLRTDMNGMSFFDPTDELKLILYPLDREQYPNYSIVRWMAFSLYSESALCSLHGMIQLFYVDLHRQSDLRRVVETLGEMTESFAELYDLDIRRHLYRQEYEKLRELAKIDRDYAFLVEKFGSVKEDASLREQRLFNKLLVAFTVATTSISIIGTIAQVSQWTWGRILAVTIPVAVALTVVGYVTFDWVRRLLPRGR
ncbi:hypothetical protein [Hyalangium versicolor]|uniref:hypothetical protein n=1 Tax=Hyalangium versicolor TaxID=2861190 RepID=UPI001CCF3107|nr:hypothetical protein [Hyalangium versicolor]